MTLNLSRDEFFIDDPNSLWKGRSLHKLYQEAHTPWEWHAPIFERARSLGMIPFSTPFDASAVDFLEQLGVDCYKIASFENTDLPLIRKVAATGKCRGAFAASTSADGSVYQAFFGSASVLYAYIVTPASLYIFFSAFHLSIDTVVRHFFTSALYFVIAS